jgi:hypothetical protein
MKVNRRAEVRLESAGLMTSIFDGRSAVLGVVEDVSRGGMRVSTIPAAFKESVETCYAVVSGPWQDFHLALQPRWVHTTHRGMYKMIGFQIQHPPEGWTQYVQGMEHDRGADLIFAA